MIERVITGGQTGADQGGLRAARAAGIATGGFAARGWETEAGPAPWLADFGLVECETPGYPARTEANVRAADAVLWFGSTDTPGGKLTLGWCHRAGKLSLLVTAGVPIRPPRAVAFLREHPHVKVLMIAGNKESKSPGIGEQVERFLGAV
ncbi:MAG TPA: putative molybdenum carrier protein, partial [Gemmataceae bacterium]|nr:putative molybdenum carrier protein [Gemmataceae bacterium]